MKPWRRPSFSEWREKIAVPLLARAVLLQCAVWCLVISSGCERQPVNTSSEPIAVQEGVNPGSATPVPIVVRATGNTPVVPAVSAVSKASSTVRSGSVDTTTASESMQTLAEIADRLNRAATAAGSTDGGPETQRAMLEEIARLKDTINSMGVNPASPLHERVADLEVQIEALSQARGSDLTSQVLQLQQLTSEMSRYARGQKQHVDP